MERERDRDDLPTPGPGDAVPSGETDAGGPPSPFERAPDDDVAPVEERGAETEG